MAALSAIPLVGSLIGVSAALWSENEQGKTNDMLDLWIKEHESKLKELGETLREVFERFEVFGDVINDRITSEEYITLVRKTLNTGSS